jgi:hypothetical protein
LTVVGPFTYGEGANQSRQASIVQNINSTTATIATTTAAENGLFIDYVVVSGTKARAGNIMAVTDGVSATYSETVTTDIGNTSTANFAVGMAGSLLQVTCTTTANWTVKTIIRAI